MYADSRLSAIWFNQFEIEAEQKIKVELMLTSYFIEPRIIKDCLHSHGI